MADDSSSDTEGWLYSVDDRTTGEIWDGGIRNTDSAIVRWEKLNADINQAASENKPITEAQRGQLNRAYADAIAEWNRLHPPKPKPAATPPREPVPQKPVESKPAVEDTASAYAAPDVSEPRSETQKVVVDVRPGNLGVPQASVGELYWGADPVTSPADAARMSLTPPTTIEDQAKLEENISRNDPTVAGEPHPTGSAPFSRCPKNIADPVDLFTGAFTISAVDLVVPSAVGSINLTRSYRSGRPYYGPFGYGWDHTFNVYLRKLNDGRIAMWDGRLHESYFNPVGVLAWRCEAALVATIEPLPWPSDGFEVTHPRGVQWRFERPPGWTHAERIPLTRIADRHGNTVLLSYDTSNRLVSVLDDVGRGLLFQYGDCGLLETVSDHTRTRLVRYDHHPDIEHLVRVVSPATAQFQNGAATRYDYDLYAAYPAMQHNIIRVIDAVDRTYVENEYADPSAGWAFNTVTRQRFGDYEYVFQYEQIQWVPPLEDFLEDISTRTTVGRPDGSTHIYTFNYRGDLLDHRYRLNSDRSYRVISTEWRYDPQGNLTEQRAPDGTLTVFSYDTSNANPCARRNLTAVKVTAGSPGPLTRTVLETHYDQVFQLPITTVDEARGVTRFIYDFDLGVVNPTGLVKTVELPAITAPAQVSRIRFEHNSRGQVTAVISPRNARTEVTYDEAGGLQDGFILEVTNDVTGVAETTQISYGATGFQQSITEPGGAVTDFITNALGQVEQTILPAVGGLRPRVVTFFGESGNPLRVERPLGNYSEPGLTDTYLLDTFQEDALGRVTSTQIAANTARARRTRTVFDHEGRPVSVWDAAGTRTNYYYDERGLLLKEVAAVGTAAETVVLYEYDRAGRLRRSTDAVGRVTTIAPDAWGRPRNINHPTGATESLVWDVGDRLTDVTITDQPKPAEARRTLARLTFTYDKRGRRRTHTVWSFAENPSVAVPLTTRTVYDLEDNVAEIRTPRGGVTTFGYDGLGRIKSCADAQGNTTEYLYDAAGNVGEIQQHDFDGAGIRSRTFRRFYDSRRRPWRFETPTQTIDVVYDDRDSPVEQRESGGVTTRFEFGPHGELDEILLDPGGLDIRTQNLFDARGQIAAYVDPTSEKTSWQRDALGRIIRTDFADGSSWSRTLDGLGREHTRATPGGAHVILEYDDRCVGPVRITGTGFAGTQSMNPCEFEYDALGRLIRATNSVGSITRAFDSLSRLIEETSLNETVRFGYDDLLGHINLSFPDGRSELTEHDLSDRPTRVSVSAVGSLPGVVGELLADMTYAGASRPTNIRNGNGVETKITYDDAARTIRRDVISGATTLESVRILHDERGRRAVTQLVHAPSVNQLHHFDRRDRLTSTSWGFPLAPTEPDDSPAAQAAAIATVDLVAVGAANDESYDLDDADTRRRRIRSGVGGVVNNYTVGPRHRVVSAAGTPITYYADGPRAADGNHTYEIDALGRLIAVRSAATGAMIAQFNYDALGRIATGSIAGEAFSRWFAGNDRITEIVGGRLVQWSPGRIGPVPICVGDASGHQFIHADDALSSICTTDEGGSVRERHRYGPFGESQFFDDTGVTPIAEPAHGAWWRGMPFIPALTFFETPQRFYDPANGIFLSPDPLLYLDSPSPYVFARHNPVDFADPSGMTKTAATAPRRTDSGQTIAPPPPVSAVDTSWEFGHGALWTQYSKAVDDALNPSNPGWGRLVLGGLAILAAPVAAAEEWVGRSFLNIPHVIRNAGPAIGEHIGRAYLWNQQGENGEAVAEALESIVSFTAAFDAAASVGAPAFGGVESRLNERALNAARAREFEEEYVHVFRFYSAETPGSLKSRLSLQPASVQADIAAKVNSSPGFKQALAEMHMQGKEPFLSQSPFVSVGDNPLRLAMSSDPVLKKIATGASWGKHVPKYARAADIGIFRVPKSRLVFPGEGNILSTRETEMLFLGDDLEDFLVHTWSNPY